MKQKDEFKTGTILSYVYLIINNIVQILYTPFMLQKMGQAEYGVYSLCMSIVNYLTVLDFGLGNAIIKYVAENKKEDKKQQNKLNGLFLKIYGILGLCVLIIGVIIAFNVNSIFSNSLTVEEMSKAKTIITILSINVAVSLPLSVFASITIAHKSFVISKLLNIIRVIVLPIVMIPLLLNGYKSIAMSLVNSIIGTVCSILIAIYAIVKLKVRFSFDKVDKGLLKEISKFSLFAFILLVVDKINWNIDPVIIGMYISAEAVAIYSIASHIFQIYLTFPSVVSGLLLPKLTEVKDDKTATNNVFLKVSRIQLIIAIYILFGFMLVGKEFILVWAGEAYMVAYTIAVLLMSAAAIPLSFNIANVILQAKNKQKFRAIVLSLVVIFNIIISIFACKKFGILGCTIGTVVTYVVGHIIVMGIYFYKQLKLDMKKYVKNAITIIISSVAALVVSYLIKIELESLIITIALNAIIYTVIFFIVNYMFSLDNYEKQLIKNVIRRNNG